MYRLNDSTFWWFCAPTPSWNPLPGHATQACNYCHPCASVKVYDICLALWQSVWQLGQRQAHPCAKLIESFALVLWSVWQLKGTMKGEEVKPLLLCERRKRKIHVFHLFLPYSVQLRHFEDSNALSASFCYVGIFIIHQTLTWITAISRCFPLCPREQAWRPHFPCPFGQTD